MLLKPITISDIETELTFLQPNVFLVLLFVVDVDFILSILEKKSILTIPQSMIALVK